MSTKNLPSLASHVDTLDHETRLLVATAAKAAASSRLPPDEVIDIKDVNLLSFTLSAFSFLEDDDVSQKPQRSSSVATLPRIDHEVQTSGALLATAANTSDKQPQMSEEEKQQVLSTQATSLSALSSHNAGYRARRRKQATSWADAVANHCQIDPSSLPKSPRESDLKSAVAELPADKHLEILHDLLLLCLNLPSPPKKDIAEARAKQSTQASTKSMEEAGVYTPMSRYLLFVTARILGMSSHSVYHAEKAMSQQLYFIMQETGKNIDGASDAKTYHDKMKQTSQGVLADRDKESTPWKWAATGAGFILGGVALGVTGGLAAPLVAPLLATVTGGALSFLATSGGAIVIGSLFGVAGGGLTAFRAKARMQGIEEFEFVKIEEEDTPQIPSLAATIIASGFLTSEDGYIEPYRTTFQTDLKDRRDVYAIKTETKVFLSAGKALDSYVKNFLIAKGVSEVIKRTALATVFAAVALPTLVYHTACKTLDNDFQRSTDRARKAGIVLADVLEKGVQGNRPVVLIGSSLGAVTIMTCLLELHKRNLSSLVFDAIFISLPAAPSPSDWLKMRQVCARRLVNAYSSKDWVLAIIARLHTLISTRLSFGVAGLQAIDFTTASRDGEPARTAVIENVDVSDILGGHLELSAKMPAILERIGMCF